jgi:SAM-dependent methyltransferase
MSFGHACALHSGERARRRLFSKAIHRLFGWPNFLRRLQWHDLKDLAALREGMRVIDLGAGQMHYASELAKGPATGVVAVDIDLPAGSAQLVEQGMKIVRADAARLPLKDHGVDCILMSSLLQMVFDPLRLLRECRRVLRRDGHMVLSVPNRYRYIPVVMRSFVKPFLSRALRLPDADGDLVGLLNERFHVGGPQGYYSLEELTVLLGSSGFRITHHRYAPGRLGSLLWELAVLVYVRFGNIAFHLVFLCYPLARLFDVIARPTSGSEHIVRIVPADEY